MKRSKPWGRRHRHSAAWRRKGRARNRERYARLRAAGFQYHGLWTPTALLERAKVQAHIAGVSMSQVVRAALDVGIRRVTTDDIIRLTRQWDQVLGLPVAPRYPGERYDPRWQAQIVQYAGARRRARTEGKHGTDSPRDAPVAGSSAGSGDAPGDASADRAAGGAAGGA